MNSLSALNQKLCSHLKLDFTMIGELKDDLVFEGWIETRGENTLEDFYQTIVMVFNVDCGDQADFYETEVYGKSGKFSISLSPIFEKDMPDFVVCRNCGERVFIPKGYTKKNIYCTCGSGTDIPATTE